VVLIVIPGGCFGANSSITGKLHVIGNAPFSRLVCETEAKKQYVLNGEFLDELNNLQGTTVYLEGVQNEGTSDYGLPVFNVKSYQLLAIGEGTDKKVPLVGLIKSQGNELYFESKEKSYLLAGPMVQELKKLSGSKLWIVGNVKRPAWFWGKSILTPEAFQVIKKGSSK
jgi:hypothetical protein